MREFLEKNYTEGDRDSSVKLTAKALMEVPLFFLFFFFFWEINLSNFKFFIIERLLNQEAKILKLQLLQEKKLQY